MHKLIFDKKFKKKLDKIDSNTKEQIIKKLKKLKNNPELGKHLLYLDLWSLRVNKYRIIYKIKNQELMIFILNIDHRKDAYGDL